MFTRYQQDLVYIYSIYVIYIHIYIFVFSSAQLFLIFMPKLINKRITCNFMLSFNVMFIGLLLNKFRLPLVGKIGLN